MIHFVNAFLEVSFDCKCRGFFSSPASLSSSREYICLARCTEKSAAIFIFLCSTRAIGFMFSFFRKKTNFLPCQCRSLGDSASAQLHKRQDKGEGKTVQFVACRCECPHRMGETAGEKSAGMYGSVGRERQKGRRWRR